MNRTQRHRVYEFIRSYVAATGEWPTRSRIAHEMGWRAESVSDCLSALVRYGLVARVPFASRGVPLGEQYTIKET